MSQRKADAVVDLAFDALGLSGFPRRSSRAKLRDMHAQAGSGASRPGSMYQTFGNRIEPAGLHRICLQDVRPRSSAAPRRSCVGHQALDGLQAFGGRRRRHDMAAQAFVVIVVRKAANMPGVSGGWGHFPAVRHPAGGFRADLMAGAAHRKMAGTGSAKASPARPVGITGLRCGGADACVSARCRFSVSPHLQASGCRSFRASKQLGHLAR